MTAQFMMITEIAYLRAHLEQCRQALNDGVDLIGYCSWSFTDLLSWLNGYQKRYGFVYIVVRKRM
jgi:6-phospho-beta-glucosidase